MSGDWADFLDARFGPDRGVAGNWLVYSQGVHGVWRAIERAPWRPWVSATIVLGPGRTITLREWHRGVPLDVFVERAFVEGALPLPVKRAIHFSLPRGASWASAGNVRVDADGNLWVGSAPDRSGETLRECVRSIAGVRHGDVDDLAKLVRGMFPEEVRSDDLAREDLSALPIEAVREWRTIAVPSPRERIQVHDAKPVRINLRGQRRRRSVFARAREFLSR